MFQMDIDKLARKDHVTTLLGARRLGGEIAQLLAAGVKSLSVRKRIKKTSLPTSTAQGECRRRRAENAKRGQLEPWNFVMQLSLGP